MQANTTDLIYVEDTLYTVCRNLGLDLCTDDTKDDDGYTINDVVTSSEPKNIFGPLYDGKPADLNAVQKFLLGNLREMEPYDIHRLIAFEHMDFSKHDNDQFWKLSNLTAIINAAVAADIESIYEDALTNFLTELYCVVENVWENANQAVLKKVRDITWDFDYLPAEQQENCLRKLQELMKKDNAAVEATTN